MRIQFDLTTIKKWAYTTELDEEFDMSFDNDPDEFERSILNACSLLDLFHFVSDEKCKKRAYFSHHLAESLCWIYQSNTRLPFHFSRMQGIIDKDIYLAEEAKYAEAVYERCLIIEQMRTSKDSALQAFAKELLDYRHDLLISQDKYLDIIQRMHRDVLPLFSGT